MARRIVLAEDDAEFRRLLAAALFKHGCDVVECANGRELARRIDQILRHEVGASIDLIVSDIRMPGFDDLAVLEALRSVGEHLPVVLMTAFGDAETHATARLLGAHLLDKPFDVDVLIEMVDSIG